MANYVKHTEPRRMNMVNPYPGLRPFSTRDSQLFFGRSRETNEVVKTLLKNRFAVITGEPGSGKTSLLNAGVIPSLMYHGEWILFMSKPGLRPLHDLYHEVLKKQGRESVQAESAISLETEIFMQAFKDMHKEYQANILIVVDQFEEIFTQKGYANEQIHQKNLRQYVDFLLQAVGQDEVPVSVIVNLRSDFLEDCSEFSEFSDLIDLYQFPLQKMSVEDITRVIMGPLEVAGVGIQKELVKRIIQDVQENPDLLPVLQHALMKTWQAWNLNKNPVVPIGIEDYEQLGSVDHSISKSADEAYGQLSEEEKEYCERIFRALSERDHKNRDVCISLKIKKVAEITQVTIDKVIRIIDVFRREGRGFIVPDIEIPLEKNTVISVSHESLMKLWYRLDEWADEEYESVQMYLKLADAAGYYQTGKAELWRPPDLEIALEWYRKNKPNLAWAERYNPAFERTMVFLTTSEREFGIEEEDRFQEEKRKRILNRLLSGILAIAAVIAIIIFSLQRVQNTPKGDQNETETGTQQESTVKEGQIAQTNPSSPEQGITGQNTIPAGDSQSSNPQIGQNASALTSQTDDQTSPKNMTPSENPQENKTTETPQENIRPHNTESTLALNSPEEKSVEPENKPAGHQATETHNTQPAATTVAITAEKILPVIRSMAGMSLKLSGDPDLNALLAYQAYLFNEEYNGSGFNADIYSGLYQAVKTFRGDKYNVLQGHTNAVRSLDFVQGTSAFYSGGSDGSILKWNLDDKQNRPSTLVSGRNIIDMVKVTPNGKWLLYAERNAGLSLINLSGSSSAPEQMTGSEKNIRTMTVSSDNNSVYTAGFDPYIELWNITIRSARKITDTESQVNSLSVSPDGTMLAGALRDGKTMIWNLKENMKAQTINTNQKDAIQTVQFSQDGRYLACGSLNGNILLFRVGSFELISTLQGHKARVTSLDFSPDGNTLVSGSYDGQVILWNLSTPSGKPVIMTDNSGFVFTVGFSPDGKYFVSGSANEPRLVARPAKASMLASQICMLVKRDMTPDEWNKYVGSDIPYRKTCSGKGSE